MARMAMVYDDEPRYVANVIELEPEGSGLGAPPGFSLIEDTQRQASPGGTYDGSAFLFPPGLVPVTVEAQK